MTEKILLVAFNGEPMCFVHVLLNALDLAERGHETKVVIEGSAAGLPGKLAEGPFAGLYARVREQGLIDCVCQACAAKMGGLEAAQAQNLPLCGEMTGHPSLGRYIEQGYRVITF